MTTPGSILALNAGSSSLKFAIFDVAETMPVRVRGKIEDLDSSPHLIARAADGLKLADRRWPQGAGHPLADAAQNLLAFIDEHLGQIPLLAVGHRIVHGGADHIAPEVMTPLLFAELEALTPLDPLHMPSCLAPVRAMAASRPGLAQVACFDTAFHQTMPLVATQYALPRSVTAKGVKHYGFHGLSYEYISSRLRQVAPALAAGRVIVAHLGAGASLCALQNGQSIATTTGFSALDGLMMATRCGSLDPGVILYLGRQGHSFDDIEDMLYRRSGLLGVSGMSGDVRTLLASDDLRCAQAIDLFVYRMALEVGSMVSVLNGLDGLVFTAGIGEHSAAIRSAVCGRLTWLGLKLDTSANASGADRISAVGSAIDVRVISTDEEAMIAQHTGQLVQSATAQ